MTTSELIEKRRKELGLSLQQLGDRVGVSKVTISRWEHGNTATIKQTMIVKLAQALSISPVDLIYPDDALFVPPIVVQKNSVIAFDGDGANHQYLLTEKQMSALLAFLDSIKE